MKSPDVPPAWDKIFRCAVCGTKVGDITDGQLRTRKLPMECPTHGELANPSAEHWVDRTWSQHARDGGRVTIKLNPVQ